MKGLHFAAAAIALGLLTAFGQSALAESGPALMHPAADLDQVAGVIPRGNLNPVAGGHVRPVNHVYLEYLVPRAGGSAALDVDAMAAGEIVLVFHRQTDACVVPDPTVPSGCATGPSARAMIDEYQIFTQHTDYLSSFPSWTPPHIVRCPRNRVNSS